MKKKRKENTTRNKLLFLLCLVCGVILIISTYAWFIGLNDVTVEMFDVKISSTDSLQISLNGVDWSDTVVINSKNYNDPDVVGEGSTNSWSSLHPISSVGVIDETSSRLELYEKGSLTKSEGGYRLLASRVPNYDESEADGYVAFDLFIKNKSSNEYYVEYDPLNEEALYLAPESIVEVAENGGEENTGIENSVRVAFAQIGRVISTTYTEDGSEIRSIMCDSGGDVTSICSRVATIWEPNDTKHVQNAINWYNTSCKHRVGFNVYDKSSYYGTCNNITDGTAYPTYAVGGVIDVDDNVDVYDGAEYNGYQSSISNQPTEGKLYKFPYFTDTMKNYTGTVRPEFMTVAPNSITKIRVYVYIEGQDIDNYDFAQLGKKISVSFGFTKERFYGEDIDYDGYPELPDDVVRTRVVHYNNTGNIVPDDSRITYDYDKKEFTIPNWFRAFSFTDDDVEIIAKGVDQAGDVVWEFEKK